MGRGEKMDSPAVYTQAVGGGGGVMFSLLKESGDRRTLRKSQEKCLQVFLVPYSCFRLKGGNSNRVTGNLISTRHEECPLLG